MDFEEIKQNPLKYIKTFTMDIVVVIVAVAYIFYQMVKLEPTQENPWVLLMQAFVGILCGLSIKQALGENGFTKGYKSDTWKYEYDLYNQACNSVIDYSDRVDNFRLLVEKEKREAYRRTNLQAVRLKYDDWFDKEGNFIGTNESVAKLDFRQKRMLNRCVKVKIYVLDLLSGISNITKEDTKKEPTDNTQREKTFFKNFFGAVALALGGVYFIPFFDTWDTARFITSLLQVSMWILFGIFQLYTNFDFVVQDKVCILRKKKELIARFKKECDLDMHKKPYYEEQVNVASC